MKVTLSIVLYLSIRGVDALRGSPSLAQLKASVIARDITQPNIQVGALDKVDSPEDFSGISFDPSTQAYGYEFGDAAQQLNQQQQSVPGGMLTVPGRANYGMNNTVFQTPAVSYSDAINSYQPPDFAVTPCDASNSYSPDSCTKGSELYNIVLNNPLPASLSR